MLDGVNIDFVKTPNASLLYLTSRELVLKKALDSVNFSEKERKREKSRLRKIPCEQSQT